MRIFIRLHSPTIPSRIQIPSDKAHYMINVMRVRNGDVFEVFDEAGNTFKAKVTEIGGKQIHADLLERLPPARQPRVRLVICPSLLKGQKNDLIVQKTTELGVSEICPIVTRRSIPKDTSRTVRWRKIAEEASEQSGRSDVPLIREPVPYLSLFRPDGIIPRGKGLILSTSRGISIREGLRTVLEDDPLAFAECAAEGQGVQQSVFLVVGPEGGFTADEEDIGLRHGLTPVSMGGLILRAETAAIAATAIIQYLIREDVCDRVRSTRM